MTNRKALISKRILYVEEGYTGHSRIFTKFAVEHLAKIGFSVDLLTSADAMNSTGYPDFIKSLSSADKVFPRIAPYKRSVFKIYPLSLWFRIRRALQETCSTGSYDVIFLANVSSLYRAIGILGSLLNNKVPIVCMLVTSSFHLHVFGLKGKEAVRDKFNRWAFKNFLKNNSIKQVFTFDPYLKQFCLGRYPYDNKIIEIDLPWTCSESFNMRSNCCTISNQNIRSKFRILVYGVISKRKGLETLLEAAKYPELRGKIEIVIAGIQYIDAQKLISKFRYACPDCADMLTEINHFVSQAEESALLEDCDVVWVAYKDFYDTSGVLLNAYAYGKPVIGCAQGNIAADIIKHGTGLLIDNESITAARNAIKIMMDYPEILQLVGNRGLDVASARSPDAIFNMLAERTTEAIN